MPYNFHFVAKEAEGRGHSVCTRRHKSSKEWWAEISDMKFEPRILGFQMYTVCLRLNKLNKMAKRGNKYKSRKQINQSLHS